MNRSHDRICKIIRSYKIEYTIVSADNTIVYAVECDRICSRMRSYTYDIRSFKIEYTIVYAYNTIVYAVEYNRISLTIRSCKQTIRSYTYNIRSYFLHIRSYMTFQGSVVPRSAVWKRFIVPGFMVSRSPSRNAPSI